MPIVPPTLRAGSGDLPLVPPLVQYLIGCWLPSILTWVEAMLIRLVLLRCRDHPLVQSAQGYDPAPLLTACAGSYHADGTKATPATFRVDLLVRAESVRAWAEHCSDRDLEWHLLSNLVVRWFVGLSLLAPVPDHTTLARFHAWLADQQPDALFAAVRAFLEQIDPQDAASTPQIVDTFGMQPPPATSPRIANLLLALCADLIAAWQQQAPLPLVRAVPPLDHGPIVAALRPGDRVERQALLLPALSLAERLLADLTAPLAGVPQPSREVIARLTSAIAKGIADQLLLDASGQPTERTDKAMSRIISATDLDAIP